MKSRRNQVLKFKSRTLLTFESAKNTGHAGNVDTDTTTTTFPTTGVLLKETKKGMSAR